MSKTLCILNLKNTLLSAIEHDNKGYKALESLYQACLADATTASAASADADTDADESALKSLFSCISDLRREFRDSGKISEAEKANSTLLYNRLSVALRLWISKQSTKIQGLIQSLGLIKSRKAGGGRKPAATDSSPNADNNVNNASDSGIIVTSDKQPAVTQDVITAMVQAAEKEATKKLVEHLLATYFVQANRELSSFKKQFPKIYAKQLGLYNHLQAILNG